MRSWILASQLRGIEIGDVDVVGIHGNSSVFETGSAGKSAATISRSTLGLLREDRRREQIDAVEIREQRRAREVADHHVVHGEHQQRDLLGRPAPRRRATPPPSRRRDRRPARSTRAASASGAVRRRASPATPGAAGSGGRCSSSITRAITVPGSLALGVLDAELAEDREHRADAALEHGARRAPPCSGSGCRATGSGDRPRVATSRSVVPAKPRSAKSASAASRMRSAVSSPLRRDGSRGWTRAVSGNGSAPKKLTIASFIRIGGVCQ